MAEEKNKQRKHKRDVDEEAYKEERAKEKKRKLEKIDATARRKNFSRAVIFGPIFTCSCCHRQLFENGVTKITDRLKEKVNKKVPYSSIIPESQEVEVKITFNGSTSLSGCYICHTCKKSILSGKLPAMAVQNGLHLIKLDDDMKLTELENNLIAQMINFQYIYQLPNSRWGATKNQMISVPVTQDKIQETMSQLPRVPKDACLFPVELKRKMEYKNNHKQAFIDPEKTLRVVQMLKTFGHPDYQFYEDLNIDSYKNRCKEQDENGYKLLFDNESDSDGEKVGLEDASKSQEETTKDSSDGYDNTDIINFIYGGCTINIHIINCH